MTRTAVDDKKELIMAQSAGSPATEEVRSVGSSPARAVGGTAEGHRLAEADEGTLAEPATK